MGDTAIIIKCNNNINLAEVSLMVSCRKSYCLDGNYYSIVVQCRYGAVSPRGGCCRGLIEITSGDCIIALR